MDPASDKEEPEDVDACIVTGYVDDGRVGMLLTAVYDLQCCRPPLWDGKHTSGTYCCCSGGGVGRRVPVEVVVNLEHPKIRVLSSGMEILLRGSVSKMRLRIKSSSEDNGSIDERNLGLFR